MTSSKVEPVRKSVVVNTGIERAFALFIDKFDAIKRAISDFLRRGLACRISVAGCCRGESVSL